jgi:hypothetical protein
MDGALLEFMESSGFQSRHGNGRRRGNVNGSGKRKVEGIWVRCRGSGGVRDDEIWEERDGSESGERNSGGEEDEEDEMIWWSWDGKLVGFSDW